MYEKAIILAGGKGTRLRPYTAVLPKPLMPVGEYPILEVIIRQLKQQGFKSVTLAVNHQAELIKTFFGDGHRLGIDIEYSMETQPLGTMGPVKQIRDLPDNFLVMNGDILTDLRYGDLMEYHKKRGGVFTVASMARETIIDYGVLQVSGGDKLEGFLEKPRERYDVSMGVYALSKRVVEFIPEDEPFGFDQLMHKLLLAKRQINVFSYDGLWLDIGRPDDYMLAIDSFETDKDRYLAIG